MSSQDMISDFNQINDFNPFIPGETSILPGASNADVDFKNSDVVHEPAQWDIVESPTCVEGEVRLGCRAPKHCTLERDALPSYDFEQGAWTLSGARCASKTKSIGGDMKTIVALLMVVLAIFYLRDM